MINQPQEQHRRLEVKPTCHSNIWMHVEDFYKNSKAIIYIYTLDKKET
jgi:hypothetical protein